MRINNRAAIKTCKEVRNIVSTFRLISCSFDSTNERTIYRYITYVQFYDLISIKKKENLISIHHCTRNDTAWGKRNLYQMILCGRPTDA